MNNMKKLTVHEALKWASSFLEKHDKELKIAEILLLHQLNWAKTDLITRLRNEMAPEEYRSFQEKVKLHVTTNIPVQHITGAESFYGRTFQVNRHVLIPRPETEELVQHVLHKINDFPLICADVGTGSGVIAVTLAKEWEGKEAEVLATDISAEALETAKHNALQQEAAVEFYQGNYLQPLIDHKKKVDVIVSNPPYIAYEEADFLSETVKNYDPALALFAENSGLFAYEQMIAQAPFVLKEKGSMFFEIGHTQGEAVSALIRKYFPASEVDILQDINGKDRIVSVNLL